MAVRKRQSKYNSYRQSAISVLICERRDSGEKQSSYTLERKVHQGGKYARAETIKSIRFQPRGVCFGRASLAKSCCYTEIYRSRVPIINLLSMPRICERRDSGEKQSLYTLERKVHQGRKYARAETFKLICLSSPLAVVPTGGTDKST